MIKDPRSRVSPRQVGRPGRQWFLDQIRAKAFLGHLAPGDRLPSVRSLAQQLAVSPTTVLDLYRTLQAEGFVEGRERQGLFLRRPSVAPAERPGDRAAFELVTTLATQLAASGVAEADFARMLSRYTGAERRDDFKVALVGYREAVELLDAQLRRRLGFSLDFVHVAPCRTAWRLRAAVAGDPTIRCVVTSYLMSPEVRKLAGEMGLPFVAIRLSAQAAKVFAGPDSGRTFVVVRDQDTAAALRQAATSLARFSARPGRVATGEGERSLADDSSHPGQPQGVSFAALSEEALLADFDAHAEVVQVATTALDGARARWGATKQVMPFAVEVSEDTLDELVFHYVCGASAPPSVLGHRQSPEGRGHAGSWRGRPVLVRAR